MFCKTVWGLKKIALTNKNICSIMEEHKSAERQRTAENVLAGRAGQGDREEKPGRKAVQSGSAIAG